ncbi:MAG: hypothetical protein HONBIEJF_02539 [Fimbriimonadaceae bacterium]|nr:hypothetical protein [Fimbriimonadaceae bacterium]
MPTVTYSNLNGRIWAEKRGGTRHVVLADPSANVRALANAAGSLVHRYTYWPYGAVRSGDSTQTTQLFLGTLGPNRDSSARTHMGLRENLVVVGRWSSCDVLWPWMAAYAYGNVSPFVYVDPMGTRPWYYNCFYKWLYTGDCYASDDVFEAALDGGVSGAGCYVDCMADANKVMAMIAGGSIGLFGGGIPKKFLGLPVFPGSSPYTSLASWLNYLSCKYFIDPQMRPILRRVKDLITFCATNPQVCARTALQVVLALNAVFAAVCAYKCSNPEGDNPCEDCSFPGSNRVDELPSQAAYELHYA